MSTARARALDAAMRRAGVPPECDLAAVERFIVLLDPEGCPGVVDQELIEHIVEWAVGLHASARAGELAEAMIARAARR
jgi:hypothetical protein